MSVVSLKNIIFTSCWFISGVAKRAQQTAGCKQARTDKRDGRTAGGDEQGRKRGRGQAGKESD